jgi:hypothetical protein
MWLIVALLVVLPFVGCTVEQRERAGGVMETVGSGAGAAAPFLPPPWNAVAGGVAAICPAIAGLLYGVKKRKSEQAVKTAIQEFSKLLDYAKRSDNKDLVKAAETILGYIDACKDSAPQDLAKLFSLYDQIRKGLK